MTQPPAPSPQTAPEAGMSGRNTLAGFDLLHLLGVLAAAGQSGVLDIERPQAAGPVGTQAAQNFAITLRGGRVVSAQGPYNLTGPAVLAELLRRPEGTFLFRSVAFAADEPQESAVSTDSFGYQALLLLPPPPLPFAGAARLVSIERLTELGLTPQEAELLEDLDLGMPLRDAADTPQAQAFVARLHKLGLLARRKLRVARLVVRLSQGPDCLIDDDIYQAWCRIKGENITHAEMRLDTGGDYLLAVTPRKKLGAAVALSAEVLLRTGLRVGQAVLMRPQPFVEEA